MAIKDKKGLAKASPKQIANELRQAGNLIPNPMDVARAIKRPHYQQSQNKRIYAKRGR